MERKVLLSVRNASRIFRMGEVEVPALRDASLDILDGEFMVIIGPSGSGKSTLLNLIGGMDHPTSGKVLYEGIDLAQATDQALTEYRRQQVGFVFQFYNLAPMLTALENVQVATEIASDPLDPGEALALVGLAGYENHFPSQMSGGEQQRVAIARALAGNPKLLLCDEPTGALDLATSRQVLALLVRLKEELGKTLVLITHNSAIAGIGDRIATIRDGGIHSLQVNARPVPVDEVTW
ncbi:macrolide ABC transporter ATP-binding protein [bacterium endosymbiont of Escarpia laminata]|nr:MAG: macrolide ABC transporter ATP-binding protein [bacterium endosymbiont of Escarpia laminata]RLJ18205.1 MAG: macrolide ABC transporter ATP-binding protein [bacterium endosymbiont of Escarpia laminata]